MHRTRGLDLQCRETSALFVIEQVRDLARGAPTRLRRHPAKAVLPGDFHEGSDVVGDVRKRFHEAGRLDLPVEPICCTGEEFAGPEP
ncbi:MULTISPECIES: hypothetical protein [unclassified Methanoculleus]|uniref:hypothetical protein n=1 Tax=unclassified Methanoculleus TaxID=2619537 RepID=UPI001B6CA326|nr:MULTISPECIES: hypothetical protein [unclassified Methanoculleus]MBP7410719.1 hypothetical protein [Methanoculleus sp.]MDD2255219.1 hypothetical protein [Methanoculleus sp.]MDD2787932.1 hypothetical protein [Methanoculleus sp.]MDD3217498.1 hypothetical protein [Methanoculleus sp.]MDD4472189.1 hypothetical protein [Methanoculleus sp.]